VDAPTISHGRHHEHLATRVAAGGGGADARPRAWWDRTPLWWIAVLFAIGSTCFLVAALASQWAAVTRPGIAVTFFAGSILFTSAAYLQHWLAVRAVTGRPPLRARPHLRLAHPDSWPNAHVDALATLIQLVGTLLFNLNTYNAMDASLTAAEANLRVWTPDMLGSACFLVASALAFANGSRGWLAFRLRSRGWWVNAVNLLGSIAFGAAAIASLVQPATNEPVSAAIANGATAAGALGFLVGALLLLPDASPRPHPAAQANVADRRQPSR
jgi:YrhK-like protein